MLPPISGGLAGIGQGLGNAHGSIVIDTSDLDRASKVAGAAGRNIGQSLQQRIGGGARNAIQGIRSLSGEIRKFNRELAVIGAGAGLVTAFGLGSARDLRAYRIAFETLLGSQREGDRVMQQLTESANEFGLEMNNVLALGRALLPLLEGNADATEEWVLRAARLRAVLPTAQTGAELRAITEFLADQTISLQRLFNIPPELIQEARRQFDDAGDQLDFILDKMGATEEAARRMADPVVSLKNELRLIAAIGFTPLLEDVRETATEFREWLENIRQTHPELLQIGASAVAAVAIGAPLLVFLNQVASLLETIGSARLLALGRALGTAGILAAAVAGGGAIGLGLGRGIGRATGNEQVAETTASDILTTIRQVLFIAADSFLKLADIAAISYANAINNVIGGLELFTRGLGFVIEAIGNLIPDVLGGERVREWGRDVSEFANSIGEAEINMDEFIQFLAEERNRNLLAIGRFLGFFDPAQDTRRTDRGRGAPERGGQGRLGQLFDQAVSDSVPGGIAEWTRFWSELLSIQQEMDAEILAAEQENEAQRLEIVSSFSRQLAREEQDFQRQRARAQEDFQRQIDDINEDRTEREVEWAEEHNDRLAQIQEDAARERERMEQDHYDNLIDAASRLDATAIFREQRRFGRESERFEEDLQRRIDQENETHEERIENARQADEERIRDLEEFHNRRLAREDEDRAIRLARMREDHERQLAQFDAQAEARLQQIRDQAQREAEAAGQAYEDRLREQGLFYTGWITQQENFQQDSLTSFQDWMGNITDAIEDAGGVTPRTGGETSRTGGTPPTFGPIPIQSGPDPTTRISPAVNTQNNSMSLSIAELSVVTQPGQSPEQVGMSVVEQIERYFEGMITGGPAAI